MGESQPAKTLHGTDVGRKIIDLHEQWRATLPSKDTSQSAFAAYILIVQHLKSHFLKQRGDMPSVLQTQTSMYILPVCDNRTPVPPQGLTG